MASTLTRREFLRLMGLVAAAATASACAPAYTQLAGGAAQPAPWPALPHADFQALSRLTYGPTPIERQRVAEIGLAAWIEEQLAPADIDDSATFWRLRRFDSLTLDASSLATWQPRFFERSPQDGVPRELQQASLVRQVYSRRQLYEVMVEFWSDHFHTFIGKEDLWFLKTVEDREVIRPHVLGGFRSLLEASATSPAMLIYLDNQVNDRAAPNENYARELLELHTLGVDGGYTQADIMALAECLTGWTIRDHWFKGRFIFKPDMHTPGPKTVLGQVIPESGKEEVLQVLDLLAEHPSTAEFIATKLVRRFIADPPPAELIALTARAFQQSHGDLLATVRTLLLDGLVARPDLVQPRYKRPIHFVAGALRLLAAETDASDPILLALNRMGQLPFNWPTPDGYPDTDVAWQGNLMARWQFALGLARNDFAGTQINLPALVSAADTDDPLTLTDRFADLLLGQPLATPIRNGLMQSLNPSVISHQELPALLLAGMLAGPGYQWR